VDDVEHFVGRIKRKVLRQAPEPAVDEVPATS
jgi:hypothetical protein